MYTTLMWYIVITHQATHRCCACSAPSSHVAGRLTWAVDAVQIVMSVVAIVLCYVATPKTPKEHAAATRVSSTFTWQLLIVCSLLCINTLPSMQALYAAGVQCTSMPACRWHCSLQWTTSGNFVNCVGITKLSKVAHVYIGLDKLLLSLQLHTFSRLLRSMPARLLHHIVLTTI